jgi:glycosyltransferase involved in cell wall biosynthesis
MKICFFAKVKDKKELSVIDFYQQDLRILQELGHEVFIATKYSEIPVNCDLYFIWWWTWAFLPIFKTLFTKKYIITGTFNYENPQNSFHSRPFLQKFLIKIALERSNANIFVSKYEYELVKNNLKVKNPSYSPHIVDIELFKPIDSKKENFLLNLAFSDKGNAIRKCLPEIIESFAIIIKEFPELRLTMAGMQGDYFEELKKKAESLNISNSIDFLGEVSLAQKINLMQKCKLFLQPTNFEGFGLAIVEAMACGAIPVTSPVGAVSEVVDDAGVYVDGKNVKDLASKTIELLKNDELLKSLSQKARLKVVENYTFAVRFNHVKNVISYLGK